MRIKRKIAGYIIAAAFAGLTGTSAFAYEYLPPEPFGTFTAEQAGERNYLAVGQKTVVDRDITIEEGQSLDIAAGSLVITDGAELTVKGSLFIEREGTLEIENGTLTIQGRSADVTDCGTLKIGEKGVLRLKSGRFYTSCSGTVENNGKIACMSSDRELNGIFRSIKKYDENFELSDYSLFIWSRTGGDADIELNYRIGDVMTDYGYRFTVDVNKVNSKTRVRRSPMDMETVYGGEVREDVTARAAGFEESYGGVPEGAFRVDSGYSYSYKTGGLTYEASWFTYDSAEDMVMDGVYSADIE